MEGIHIKKIYGYCRISRPTQNIDRQIRNIKELYDEAIIVEEIYTGTKIVGREKWNQLVKQVESGDTIVFDSVSRMSRDAEKGFELYQELFQRNVELIFLKEQHINTSTYKKAKEKSIPMTGTSIDKILEGVNGFLLELAREQIKLAFKQSEKEVKDLQKRTSEGIKTAKLNGKQIGQAKGSKLITKKSILFKKEILKYSKDFKGSLSDKDTIKLLGISRNTYYKYKKELSHELQEKQYE
ncbi:recombinase family protein [Metaclostridioides mangenotii]|uniref:DNA invertase Pin-like site-specific DNA recombinase n=1 Tax=Metaclostridioides mangenotii TaxID=1540 RepID=A0ABS4EEM1_9FIRM|nr:recombinase family protein [Clostridioides mangenotii]MBP1856379.1 DNA invertase Pin-like site-specific DNA recombinase [Clostridioides mangenotii]